MILLYIQIFDANDLFGGNGTSHQGSKLFSNYYIMVTFNMVCWEIIPKMIKIEVTFGSNLLLLVTHSLTHSLSLSPSISFSISFSLSLSLSLSRLLRILHISEVKPIPLDYIDSEIIFYHPNHVSTECVVRES